eukprot:Pgem_evm1s19910
MCEIPCPVDCVVENKWGEWGPCEGLDKGNGSCGDGLKSRTRGITQPALHGGKGCPSLKEEGKCSVPCPVDCVLEKNWG